MIELKNKEGKVIRLIKLNLISEIEENHDGINGCHLRVYKTDNPSIYVTVFNTMEDIQAQIRAIKGIVLVTHPTTKRREADPLNEAYLVKKMSNIEPSEGVSHTITFEDLPTTEEYRVSPPDPKIVIDYDVSAKDKNGITEVKVGDNILSKDSYTIDGSTLIIDKGAAKYM